MRSETRRFLRGVCIAVHQAHIPPRESSKSIRIEIRWQRLQRGFNRRGAAFPEKLHVAALDFYVEGIRGQCEHSIHSLGCSLPIAQAKVGLRCIVEHDGIARIDLFRVLISSERLCQIPAPSLNCRYIEANVSIVRKYFRRERSEERRVG